MSKTISKTYEKLKAEIQDLLSHNRGKSFTLSEITEKIELQNKPVSPRKEMDLLFAVHDAISEMKKVGTIEGKIHESVEGKAEYFRIR